MSRCKECFFDVYKEEGKEINCNPCQNADEDHKCENFISVDYFSGEYSEALTREYEMMEDFIEVPEHF